MPTIYPNMRTFSWVPWYINTNCHRSRPFVIAWLCIGKYVVSWGCPCDPEEREVFRFGYLCITRPETEQEREDREEAECEAWFMEREANRYTEWSY